MKVGADVLLVLGLLGLFSWLYTGTVTPAPYVYDEADYMYAASLGWRANYTDRPTLPFIDFLRIGLDRGAQAGRRASLSALVRENDDIVFYRHWHGPLLSYWLMALSRLSLDEFGVRSAMIVVHILTFLIIYGGCRSILPGATGRLAAVFCSAFYLFAFSNIKAASELSPHPIFVLSYVTCLFCIAKMAVSADLRWRYAVAVATALAFCSLEITLALLATLPVCCFLFRRELFAGWTRSRWLRFAAGPTAVFAAAVLLIWPGAWWRLSFIKAYLFMAYLAVSRKAAWGSTLSVLDTWLLRFTNSPVEWVLIAAALFFFIRSWRRRQEERLAVPFLVYGCFMILLIARVNADAPRYLSPFLPALEIFAGIVLSLELSRLRVLPRVLLTAGLGMALWWNSHRQFLAHPWNPAPVEASILACLKQQDLRGKSILVPWLYVPTAHYYFPGVRIQRYEEESNLPDAIRGGDFDGVLYVGPVRFRRLSASDNLN
jgi:hypothetical protein